MKNVAFALLAGGLGSRMMGLRMPKPLLPFGRGMRLIDYSVQNVRRSGGRKLVVMLKSHRQEIVDTLLRSYPPTPDFSLDFGPWNDVYTAAGRSDILAREAPFAEHGTADALLTHRQQLSNAETRDVFVLHSDHVYAFDYREMLRFHRTTGAAATIGYQRIDPRYVHLFGMVVFNAEGQLTSFIEKPERPTSATVFTAVAVFRADVLYQVIEQLQRSHWSHDISRDVIPTMLDRGDQVVGYPFAGFWTDIGTLERYYETQMACLHSGAGSELDAIVPTLECCTLDQRTDSLIASSANIQGSVQGTIVYERATVMPGARVTRSIVLPGAIVHGTVQDTVVRSGESVLNRQGLAELQESSM